MAHNTISGIMMGKTRQWRVDAIHVNGYHAPHILIETQTDRLCKAEAEALNLAKTVSIFSKMKDWEVSVTLTNRKLFRGKWYSESEFQYKLDRSKGAI
jgi:hypothetical protein